VPPAWPYFRTDAPLHIDTSVGKKRNERMWRNISLHRQHIDDE